MREHMSSVDLRTKIDQFFVTYRALKREIPELVADWGDDDEARDKGDAIHSLLGQLDEYRNAIDELSRTDLAHHAERISRLLDAANRAIKEIKRLTKSPVREFIEQACIALLIVFFVRTYLIGWYHVPTGSAEPTMLVGDRIVSDKISYYLRDVERGELVTFDDPEFVYSTNPIERIWQKYVGISVPFLPFRDGPMNVVKRVIAIPGDTIEGRIEEGKPVIYLNGEKLNEPYLNPYPLIHLSKTQGLISPDSPFAGFVPKRLIEHSRHVRYTYNPEKSYEDQEFYLMSESDVIKHPYTGKPVLDYPDRPSYNEYGRNVDVFGPFTLPADQYWVQGDSRRNSRDVRYWSCMLDRKFIRGRALIILFSIDSEEEFFLIPGLATLLTIIKSPVQYFTKQIRYDRICRLPK